MKEKTLNAGENASQRSGSVTVLAIETSCDETAAAVVRRDAAGAGHILSNVVRSQWAEHAPYGGVVPEIAARAHLACLDDIVAEALSTAGADHDHIDLIAATAGPGLVGGLLVGLNFAKGLALATGKPVVPINHLEGHALTCGLTDQVRPPFLLLLVSGGHTQTILVEAVGHYRRIGTTIDDALGEAFDKTAKLLDLGAPGGPAVEKMAATGNGDAVPLPRPMVGRADPNFSFAGLKTAVRRAAQAASKTSDEQQPADIAETSVADICASFQMAVGDVVVDRTRHAMGVFEAATRDDDNRKTLVVAGGVAANQNLRDRLTDLCDDAGYRLVAPPISLCSDNAAMIGWAAAERWATGLIDLDSEIGFTQTARARWPLDADAEPVLGHGRLGAKA
ncbi:MAG: tRNA (adenosine(37)-N6)-threonylcarbamoyltransferase complex transferase subunit TsaD [Pseudomonadota bacterium]